jgi:hypothetical protein
VKGADALTVLVCRELMWNKWKNDGCPSFALKPLAKEEAEQERNKWEELAKNRKRKARLGDMVNYIHFLNFFFFWGGIFSTFFVLYSALLHLPPLRFHCADGCWDRTQDRCNWCISSQTL